MFGKKKTKAENIQEETYDPYLLEQIQPSGGITFQDTRYVETGTGYETCIHVYDFPQKLDDFWMAKVCNINNTVVTVDISTDNVMEVQKNINRSMKEQQYRYMEAQNFQEKYDAKQRFQEMERLYEEISSLGEVIKLLHIRIFVADHSYIRLEEKVKNILAKLESNGFRAAIFLNESKTEWESMYRPYKEQQSEDLFFIYGQPLTSNALAAGNPFHFSSLQDPCGDFLGKTPCGGNVLFDEFHKSKTRRFYNSLAVGTMGSGKSTLLKKRFLTNAIKGNYVRTFDISGEFTTLTKTLGGKVLKLDGTNGILNPLEVLKAEEGYYEKYKNMSTPTVPGDTAGTVAPGIAGTINRSERMKWLFPNGTPKSAAQMQQYLVTITVPIVSSKGAESTMTLRVHKKLANEYIAIFKEMKAIGFPVRASDTAAYVWRTMATNGSKISYHSYGSVVDLNMIL